MKIVFLTIGLFLPLLTLGSDLEEDDSEQIFKNPLQGENDTFEDLLEALGSFVFWIVIALIPIVFLVAAVQLFGAGDDPKKVENAKNIIKWAIIGLAIILLATALFNLIRGIVIDDLDYEDGFGKIERSYQINSFV